MTVRTAQEGTQEEHVYQVKITHFIYTEEEDERGGASDTCNCRRNAHFTLISSTPRSFYTKTAPARLFYIHTYICNDISDCKPVSRCYSVFTGQMMVKWFRFEKKKLHLGKVASGQLSELAAITALWVTETDGRRDPGPATS